MMNPILGLIVIVSISVIHCAPNNYGDDSEQIMLQSIANSAANVIQPNNKCLRQTICYDKIGCFDSDGPMAHTLTLPDSPEDMDIQYYAFKPDYIEKEYRLDLNNNETLKVIDTKKKLAIIIHGYTNDYTCDVLVAIKNSLLKWASNDIGTVILVDWAEGAKGPLYHKAAANCQSTGRYIAYSVNELIKKIKIHPNQVYLIGFSLGAQVAGFAGKYSQSEYNWKFGRITGLDAAAPLFEGHPGTYLTKDDAHFVDGIHTSIGNNILLAELGFTEPYAHVDFYPNGGKNQPMCHLGSGITCNHRAATVYYEASLSAHCKFLGHPCDNYQDYEDGKCQQTNDVMGYQTYQHENVRGKQYMYTSDKYPFCDKN